VLVQDASDSAAAFRGELEGMRAREQAQAALVSAELRRGFFCCFGFRFSLSFSFLFVFFPVLF
jgi:hypothetical protein